MAGDWIKIQHVTPDKPEIYQLASTLGVTPEDAFGRCVRIWIWADQQSLNGHALSVTFVTLDSISRHNGFGAALAKVGWVHDNNDGTVTFPNFYRHNGETSKTRADAAMRKKKQREKEASGVTDMSQENRDKTVTREEKSKPISIPDGIDSATAKKSPRFDAGKYLMSLGINKQLANDWLAVRKGKKAAPTKTAIDGVASEAGKAGIPLAEALAICCRQGWAGFKESWDWKPERSVAPSRPVNGRQAAISNYAAQAAEARGEHELSIRDITGEAVRVA